MSPKAMVKEISATGFTEAIDLMACLAVLRSSAFCTMVAARAAFAASKARGTTRELPSATSADDC
jgi:hypothetical protein